MHSVESCITLSFINSLEVEQNLNEFSLFHYFKMNILTIFTPFDDLGCFGLECSSFNSTLRMLSLSFSSFGPKGSSIYSYKQKSIYAYKI